MFQLLPSPPRLCSLYSILRLLNIVVPCFNTAWFISLNERYSSIRTIGFSLASRLSLRTVSAMLSSVPVTTASKFSLLSLVFSLPGIAGLFKSVCLRVSPQERILDLSSFEAFTVNVVATIFEGSTPST